MSDVGALLRYLKKRDKGVEILIEGNTYSSEQIKLAQQLLIDAQKELDQSRKKPKLSRRRAFIVILEEGYYDVKEYPKELTLESVHRKASQRFEFSHRAMNSFTTPNEVHPKDPCSHYENDGLRKAKYRQTLAHLVTYSQLYFSIKEAAQSLEATYRDILQC